MTSSHREASGRRKRRLLVVGLVAIGLPLAAGLALKAMFPPERLREIAEPQIERRLARDVEIESVRLKLVPYVAIRLGGVAIANAPGFSESPAIQFDALDLRLRLLPLLRRRYELSQVRLVRPLVRYEVSADGSNNLAGLLASDSSAERAPRARTGSFEVRDLLVSDGDLLFRDASRRRAGRVGLDGRFETSPSSGSSTFEAIGTLNLADGLVVSRGSDSTRVPDVAATFRALVSPEDGRVAVSELSATVANVRLAGEASSRVEEDGRRVRLELESSEFDIDDLLRAVRTAPSRADTLQATGRARVEVRWAGILGDPGPELSGTMSIAGVSIETPARGPIVDGLSGRLEYSGAGVRSSDLAGRLFGRPFTARLTIDDPGDPVAAGHFSGVLDIERLYEFRAGEPLPLDGEAALDVDFRGPFGNLSEWTITGPVRLSGVTWASPSLPEPARIGDATIRLTGTGVSAESIPLRLGSSDVRVSLSSDSYLRHVLSGAEGRAPPLVQFSARSERLAAVDLRRGSTDVGYADLVKARLAGRRLDGRAPEAIAADRYRRPDLDGIRASGTVAITEWVNPPLNATGVSFAMGIADGVVEISGLSAAVYGGRLEGGLTFDAGSAEPPYELAYDLRLAGANADAVLERWTRLGRALTGSVNLAARGRAPLDEVLLPVARGFEAAGRSEFLEGRFQDFGLADALTNYLDVAADRVRGFKDLGGPFAIRDGRFFVENWRFEFRGLEGAAGGSAGLGGLLDLEIALLAEPADLAAMPFVASDPTLRALVAQLSDGGAIPLRFAVGGTVQEPEPRVDIPRLTQALRDRLSGGARQRLESEGRGALEDAGRGLLDRLRGSPADTAARRDTTARADSASPAP